MTEQSTIDATVQEKKFSFRQTRALLTYKTHLNKEEYKIWFEEKTQRTCAFFRMAHETGDEQTPYLHTHVLFSVAGGPINTKNSRFFDYGTDPETGKMIHPHIATFSKETGNKHFHNSVIYLSKEDPENADLAKGIEDKKKWFERITECSSLSEAMMQATKPSDASGIKMMYEMKAKSNVLSDWELELPYTWQREAVAEFTPPPHSGNFRKVHWYVDRAGGCGKTSLSRFLYSGEPTKWLSCKDLGTSRDSATIIRNALEQGWISHGITIDLPRTASDHDRMYSYLEEIKDGFVTATKYSGSSIVFKHPHLIVFSNWLPKFEKLSLDRWDMRILEKQGEDVICRKVDISELMSEAEPPRIPSPKAYGMYDGMPLTF